MNDLEERLLRRLMDNPERLSRNRNFHSYQDASVRRTARLSRILRSLREDLLDPAVTDITLREGRSDGHVVLELTWPSHTRTTFVSEDELAVLLDDDEVAQTLRPFLLRDAS